MPLSPWQPACHIGLDHPDSIGDRPISCCSNTILALSPFPPSLRPPLPSSFYSPFPPSYLFQATPAICSGNLDTIVDPQMPRNYLPHLLQSLGSLAAMCVQRHPKDRPAMGEVLRRLKTIRQQGEGWGNEGRKHR